MAKMVLFHGTTTKFMRTIRKRREIWPRSMSGKAVYTDKLLSDPERVYLSDVYAVQFGLISVDALGGNLLICRCIVDEERLLPDTDFMDGGEHHLRFEESEWRKCLDMTGCVSVKGPVEVDRLYVVKGKLLREMMQQPIRIRTGFMHEALKRRNQDVQDSILMFHSDRYVYRYEEWEQT